MKYVVVPTACKTITRTEYERIAPRDRAAFFKSGGRVIDRAEPEILKFLDSTPVVEIFSDLEAAKKRAEQLATNLNEEFAVAALMCTYKRVTLYSDDDMHRADGLKEVGEIVENQFATVKPKPKRKRRK